MSLFSRNPDVSDIHQSGIRNTQQIADTITNYMSPANEAAKSCILQQVLEDIIELEVTLEVTPLDTIPFDIERKIDLNKIYAYRDSYEFFMGNKFVIEERLNVLEVNGNPLARKKLFTVVRNIYHNHCAIQDPDAIIKLMNDELKLDLMTHNIISHDNITFLPSIIFYVFAECKIFKKPPL